MAEATASSDDACEHNTNSDTESSKKNLELKDSLRKQLNEFPEVLEFIASLQKYIEKQKRKLRKLKAKLKKSKSHFRNKGCQTDKWELRSVPNKVNEDEARDEDCTKEAANFEQPKECTGLVEDIKKAAEEALTNTGFVYEETSGMYYDYSTGYYYNAEYGLYYDGNTGTYFSYNSETKTYEYHSQVETVSSTPLVKKSNLLKDNATKRKRKKHQDKNKDPKRHYVGPNFEKMGDLEEGECSSGSDCCHSVDNSSESDDISKDNNCDISKQWPPCMRVMVEETQVPKVKIGTLYIITCDGGSIGREGEHSVLIPDINISKHHLNIKFDKEKGIYQATDMGSRNGTLLNGKRMSSAKQESDLFDVVHGSRIQIGSTILLCHVHDGTQTCGHCEPGLIQKEEKETVKTVSKTESHKNELKKLRKKFGMASFDENNSKIAVGYTDRAQKRRDTVGSQNHHEKTEVASLDESIKSENKGFKLLAKMGWKEGQSLGKEGQGMLEPINVVSNQGKAGIGSNVLVVENLNEGKQQIWKKAQERFQKLPTTCSAFNNENDSD